MPRCASTRRRAASSVTPPRARMRCKRNSSGAVTIRMCLHRAANSLSSRAAASSTMALYPCKAFALVRASCVMAGWVMEFKSRLAFSLAKARAARSCLSRVSPLQISSPKRSASVRRTGEPGSVISRARASPSITAQPRDSRMRAAVDFPAPVGPVNPMKI